MLKSILPNNAIIRSSRGEDAILNAIQRELFLSSLALQTCSD